MISGGVGRDTLRFIINDQNLGAEQALIAEFQKIEAAFDLAAKKGHAGSFDVEGLHVRGIERLELQMGSVSSDPNTPYLDTHSIALADGHGGGVSDALSHMFAPLSPRGPSHQLDRCASYLELGVKPTSRLSGRTLSLTRSRPASLSHLMAFQRMGRPSRRREVGFRRRDFRSP